MKKKSVILFVLSINCLLSYSQEGKMYWNSRMLTISDIKDNGFVLKNHSDNTIKIKFFIGKIENSQYLLPGGNSLTMTYPNIKVFSEIKDIFNNYSIQVFYDFDCFECDMSKINKEAQRRINNAETGNNIKMIVRIVGQAMEKLGNSDWQETGRNLNFAVDIAEFGEDVNKKGLDNAIRDKINSLIAVDPTANAIDAFAKNKYINTAIHGMRTFYDYSSRPNSANLSDLKEAVNTLFNCISIGKPIDRYSIDYKETIEPVIDRDLDGIPNIYDKCPDKKGDLEFINHPEYSGCPKSYVIEQKRLARKRAVAKIIGFYHPYDFNFRWGKSSFNIGYKHLEFLDQDYIMRVKENMIEYSYGLNAGLSINYYPFMIDLNGFYSRFKMNDLYINLFDDYPDKITYHYGLSGYLNIFPLPRLGGVTQYIMPYSGIGYEYSSLCVSKESFWKSESSENILSSVPTSAFKWKVGAKIYLGQRFSFYGEYCNPIDTKKETANREWAIGLILRIL